MDIPIDTSSSPRPFIEVLGLWLKVLKMDEAFFIKERRRASAANTLYAVLIYAVFTSVVPLIPVLVMSQARYERLTSLIPLARWLKYLPLAGFILFPVVYYIGIGLMHLVARLFRGTGDFTTIAYLVSLFYIPLGMVVTVINYIPFAGGVIGLAIQIYMLILTVRLFKTIYALSTRKALAAVFLPLLMIPIILLPIFALAFWFVPIGPVMDSIFNNLMHIQGIGTPAP